MTANDARIALNHLMKHLPANSSLGHALIDAEHRVWRIHHDGRTIGYLHWQESDGLWYRMSPVMSKLYNPEGTATPAESIGLLIERALDRSRADARADFERAIDWTVTAESRAEGRKDALIGIDRTLALCVAMDDLDAASRVPQRAYARCAGDCERDFFADTLTNSLCDECRERRGLTPPKAAPAPAAAAN